VIRFVIHGPPVAWQRPENRAGGGRRPAPKSAAYQSLVRAIATSVASRDPAFPAAKECTVLLAFYVPDHRRRDLDNCEKNVLDGMKGPIYGDDSQVEALVGVKRVDRAAARVEVIVIPSFVDVFGIVEAAVSGIAWAHASDRAGPA